MLQQLRREARQDLILEAANIARRSGCARAVAGSDTGGAVDWTGADAASFRTKRQSGLLRLALETRSSADYGLVDGRLERRKKPVFIRGLNLNHNHDLKNLFKSAATTAGGREGAFGEIYENLLKKGMERRWRG